jgi:hypothetical protein
MLGVLLWIPVDHQAQIDTTFHRWEADVRTGLNIFGPAQEMADIMTLYDFDQPTLGTWFSDGPQSHPSYRNLGFSAQASLNYCLSPKNKIGLMYGFSSFGSVNGYHAEAKYLFLDHTTHSVSIYYKKEYQNQFAFFAGPALLMNMTRRSDVDAHEWKTEPTLGALIGLDFILGKTGGAYLFFGVNALITYASSVGPFTVYSYDRTFSKTIPKSTIPFSHLNVTMGIGLY